MGSSRCRTTQKLTSHMIDRGLMKMPSRTALTITQVSICPNPDIAEIRPCQRIKKKKKKKKKTTTVEKLNVNAGNPRSKKRVDESQQNATEE
jgi:predicted RNase H-like nuclease